MSTAPPTTQDPPLREKELPIPRSRSVKADLRTTDEARQLRQTPLDYKDVFANKRPSAGADPCEYARRASMACLEQHQDNRRACQLFFED